MWVGYNNNCILYFLSVVDMNDSGNDSSDCVSHLSATQKNILISVYGGVAGFSALFCVAALLLTCYHRLYRRFAHRLVIYQLLSALVFLLVSASELSFIDYNNSSTTLKGLCGAVGFLLSVTVGTKFLVTFWLTFYLFMFAVFSKDLYRLELLYIITSIGIPLLFDWIPFVNGLYGVAGAWCWIKNWEGDCANKKILLGTIEQYLFLYAPGMTLFFIDFVLVITTITVLLYRSYCSRKSLETDPLLKRQVEKQRKALKEILPLMSYPIIFMIIFLPSLIQRIYGAIIPETNFFLFVLHAATGPSWGLFVGTTVIIHIICLVKYCGFPLSQKPYVASSFDYKVMEHNPVYTVDTVASTDAKTYFSASRESEASWYNIDSDNEFDT